MARQNAETDGSGNGALKCTLRLVDHRPMLLARCLGRHREMQEGHRRTKRETRRLKRLWCATGAADNRIEPIPCGEQEWETDDGRLILEIARHEGIEITA